MREGEVKGKGGGREEGGEGRREEEKTYHKATHQRSCTFFEQNRKRVESLSWEEFAVHL